MLHTVDPAYTLDESKDDLLDLFIHNLLLCKVSDTYKCREYNIRNPTSPLLSLSNDPLMVSRVSSVLPAYPLPELFVSKS